MKNNINITQDELELIEGHLGRSLSAMEQVNFDQRTKEDPEWQDKIKEVQLLSLGIQEVTLSRKLKEFHSSIPGTKPNMGITVSWLKRGAVAAVLILGITVLSWVLFLRPGPEERLFAAYYSPDPGLATVMGVSENYDFEKAMVDYKLGKYTAARNTWKKLHTSDPANDTLNYFIASALLANNELQNALPYFDKVLQNENSVFTQDALWYKSLVLLRQGRRNEAIAILQHTDHPDRSALLDKLEQ